MWSPVGLTISVLLGLGALWNFRSRSGPLFFGSVGLAVLAIVLLYTVSFKGVRLLAKRLIAFSIDFLLFGLTTIGLMTVLFETWAVRPSALTAMAILWIWILSLVLLDWRFAGTPGKRIMGLRLKTTGYKRPSFLGCLARNLLTFVVPLCLSGYILSILTFSRWKQSVEWSVAIALLSLVPLSIAFSGGQSLPDLILRLTVLPERAAAAQFSAVLDKRRWLFLTLASVLMGVIYGFMPGLLEAVVKGNLPGQQIYAGEREARISSTLWPHMAGGVLGPEFIQDVAVYSTFGDLPARPGEGREKAASACLASFEQSYLTVRVQIDPGAPAISADSIFASMLNIMDHFVGRPAFVALEVSKRKSLGVFDMDFPEDYVFCLTGSDKSPENNLVSMRRSIYAGSSFNAIAWLFLGDLGKYSYAEKCPVYPW